MTEEKTQNGSDNSNDTEDLAQKNQELLNNWKRAVADLENYKKRREQETPDLIRYGREMTIMQLMPSLQSLEQVLLFAPADEKYKDWLTGLKATILQLEKTMEELGVVKIKTMGAKFDPEKHEAVEEVEAEPGVIVREIQAGFTLNGKVIVPAKVAVGKNNIDK